MSERRYTDEEVAAIFRQAAETEPTTVPVPSEGKGLTLAALQEIGREVGLSPELISQAARSLDVAGRPASRSFMGLPIGVGRTVELDRPLTDTDWERLVGDLRETFQARGNVKYDGPFRQWTNGNLQALVEPTPTGHRIRLQTVRGVSRTYMSGGLAVLGGAAATAVILGVAGSLGVSSSAEGLGFMAALGLGMFVAGAVRLPGWARRRRAQFEAVTARLVAGSETPPQSLPNPTRDPG